jgi:hypothetical protein
MTNKKIWLGMLALTLIFGMTVAGCGEDTGDDGDGNGGAGGTFTLTNIPSEYNGKYAMFQGMNDDTELFVIGAQSLNMSTQTVTFSRISNGSVSLPTWTYTSNGESFVRYSGNGTVYGYIGISSAASAKGDVDANAIDSRGFRSITFSNGSATKSWEDGEIWN